MLVSPIDSAPTCQWGMSSVKVWARGQRGIRLLAVTTTRTLEAYKGCGPAPPPERLDASGRSAQAVEQYLKCSFPWSTYLTCSLSFYAARLMRLELSGTRSDSSMSQQENSVLVVFASLGDLISLI